MDISHLFLDRRSVYEILYEYSRPRRIQIIAELQ
jgi:hypothetical protein